VAVKYSDDPVTDAAVRAVVASHPKFRALCVLARETRDDALGEFAGDVPVSDADLQALVGSKIREAHGASIAGMMADYVDWAAVAAEMLRSTSNCSGTADKQGA
jgi:hypothetical protein